MVRAGKSLLVLCLIAAVGAASAWWVLLNPDNAFTRLFARDISDVNARIVIGPYPGDRDFRLLKANGVSLIVTLLDPAIPYEASLLNQEKARAGQFGIELRNFPMSSIMGRKFGSHYDASAKGAADAIAESTGKVYLHCYLGMHRIQAVRNLLAERGIESGTYAVRKGERSGARVLLDSAEAAYRERRFDEALAGLASITEADRTPDVDLLRGWCLYRLDRVAEARTAFTGVLSAAPDRVAASSGLGYCAIREGNYEEAQRRFMAVLDRDPRDADALGGLGLAYYRADRLPEAERYFSESLAIAPNPEWEEILGRIRAGRQPGAAR